MGGSKRPPLPLVPEGLSGGDIKQDDKVLVKTEHKGKLISCYNPVSYIVDEVKGRMITASCKRPKYTITRNTSFFEKFHDKEENENYDCSASFDGKEGTISN